MTAKGQMAKLNIKLTTLLLFLSNEFINFIKLLLLIIHFFKITFSKWKCMHLIDDPVNGKRFQVVLKRFLSG